MQPYQVKSQMQKNDGGVMFWNCITAEGPGYGITIIEGSINSGLYVDILKTPLDDTLEHFRKTLSDVRFQQDKATPHTSDITKQWFTDNGFNLDENMNCPPQSPDLSPIEDVWHLLKLRLNKCSTRLSTKEELERRINLEWYKITENECQKYIDSMPAQIKAVIKSKSGSTHY
ncbi:Methylenetetrahydrofolate dehydrogenase [NAD(+)] [Mucor velutinosus]|uniref:Methylenetetrahydrofolate dehydrogenase [NAD(+)] n=1 Tax=Mucor velutinosus TaxID=708070 RepID=A0AAN7DSD4_9FUNG|nr:Methylenetetrahydrofolate dehydrogenase [NAD(+)] [Mucor velutinosus]